MKILFSITLMLGCSIVNATEPPKKTPMLFGLELSQDLEVCETGNCPMPTNYTPVSTFGMQTHAPRVQRTYFQAPPQQTVSYQAIQVPVTKMVEKTVQVPVTTMVEQTVQVPVTVMETQCQQCVTETSSPMMMTTTRTRRVGFFSGFFQRLRQNRANRKSARQTQCQANSFGC
jgi:hypothetical protein